VSVLNALDEGALRRGLKPSDSKQIEGILGEILQGGTDGDNVKKRCSSSGTEGLDFGGPGGRYGPKGRTTARPQCGGEVRSLARLQGARSVPLFREMVQKAQTEQERLDILEVLLWHGAPIDAAHDGWREFARGGFGGRSGPGAETF